MICQLECKMHASNMDAVRPTASGCISELFVLCIEVDHQHMGDDCMDYCSS